MTMIRIKGAKVGFGVTIMPQNQGESVIKYYFEPDIEFEIAEEANLETLQTSIDKIAAELLENVQNAVRKKAKVDRERIKKARSAPIESFPLA